MFSAFPRGCKEYFEVIERGRYRFADGLLTEEELIAAYGLPAEIARIWVDCTENDAFSDDPAMISELFSAECESIYRSKSSFRNTMSYLKPILPLVLQGFGEEALGLVFLNSKGAAQAVYGHLNKDASPAKVTELYSSGSFLSLARKSPSTRIMIGPEHYLAEMSELISLTTHIESLDLRLDIIMRYQKGAAYSISALTSSLNLASRLVTERIRQMRLTRNQEFFESLNKNLLSFIDDGVVIANEKGEIINVNESARSAIGMKPDKRHVAEYLSSGSRRHFQTLVETGTMVNNVRITLESADGEKERLLSARPIILKSESVPRGFMLRLSDKEQPFDRFYGSNTSLGSVTFDDIVGDDPDFLQAVNLAKVVALIRANVLISGDTGTGKDMFANAIHNASQRQPYPFVTVSCAGLTMDFSEYELFGGLLRGEPITGKLEMAHAGTLYLDEICDMPLDLQGKLVQVLDMRKVTRIGEFEYRDANFRLLSSTTKDLKELVDQGFFRKDLYYRIATSPIFLPPLTRRKGDIMKVARRLVYLYSQIRNLPPISISDDARDALMGYDWPGNVRQLRSCLYYACDICRNRVITSNDLPPTIFEGRDLQKPHRDLFPEESVDEATKRCVLNALEESGYNVTKTAQLLNVSRSTVYNYMKKYSINGHGPSNA